MEVVIRTFNSERTLESCLSSITQRIPFDSLLVIDHNSTDRTVEIAESFGAEVIGEDVGLGYATTLGVEHSQAEFILFIDSDIRVTRPDFLKAARKLMETGDTGAVVGTAVGHPFLYGLPLGLTLFRRSCLSDLEIPPKAAGSETFFIRRNLRRKRLKVRYLRNSMVHNSVYRSFRFWPEWQGAQVRLSAGLAPGEFLYSLLVIFLLLTNSKSLKNFLYIPVFWAKFLRGYTDPIKWKRMDRSSIELGD